MQTHDQQIVLAEVQAKLVEAEKQVDSGKILPAKEDLAALREKYGVITLWLPAKLLLASLDFHLMPVCT